MKRFILLGLLMCIATLADAQNRKYMSSFSAVRAYYNPSFTGQEGSKLTTLYRNQWTGFEDAPKTIYAGAEFRLSDLKKSKGYQLNNQSQFTTDTQHHFGLFLFRDSFGPYSETKAQLNYSAGIHLSDKLQLNWGGGLNYTLAALDGTKLTVDQESDPRYSNVLGQKNRSGKLDLDLGITLSADKFYIGYAMQDVTEGKVMRSGDEFTDALYTRKHIGQAGFRTSITNDIGLVLNGLYQYDAQAEGTIEGQLKGVYQNMLWAGVGYRKDLAFSATAGVRINRLQLTYLYETPVADANTIDKPSNEITLAYQLRPFKENHLLNRLQVW
ncbi:type IX secretion system membrane protein PorP/SprF [Pontibacter sp. H259]|uniref:PorP/SprF family type IX secretion system membrane protein n=1 Tax=Pontibacter sp. H259 TaxID=3133421 RepID=UPI0030C3CD54